MTVSIGCAYQKNHHIDIDQLMQQADDALYQAKLSGRDNVACIDSNVKECYL